MRSLVSDSLEERLEAAQKPMGVAYHHFDPAEMRGTKESMRGPRLWRPWSRP